jgi:hypothetical protein
LKKGLAIYPIGVYNKERKTKRQGRRTQDGERKELRNRDRGRESGKGNMLPQDEGAF